MCKETCFESAEEVLEKGLDLIKKVRRQNEQWPGAGAFEKDVRSARALLRQMKQALADLIGELTLRIEDLPGEDLDMEAREAVNKAYSLISRLHDDVRAIHAALERGETQSFPLGQTSIHFQQLAHHCRQAQDHLLDARRELG